MATLSPVIVLLSVTNLCVSDEVLIKKVYDGLRRSLEFYGEYYEEINLDGMYGLVLTHGKFSFQIRLDCIGRYLLGYLLIGCSKFVISETVELQRNEIVGILFYIIL